jgi:rod shape-determining protein MreB
MILKKLVSLFFGKRVVYVLIRRNAMEARDVFSGRSASDVPTESFTTRRLLIGNFLPAETCLAGLLRKVYGSSLKLSAPTGVMHPLEMTEEGLSFVEERVLRECAEGAGCSRSIIHVGSLLSDQEVIELAQRGGEPPSARDRR